MWLSVCEGGTKTVTDADPRTRSCAESKTTNGTFILSDSVPQKRSAAQSYQHFLLEEALSYTVL